MRKQFVPILAAGVLATSLTLLADIKTDYSHSVNFGAYKTYSWIKVRAENQLWQDRIKMDVDDALQSRGWQMAPSGGDTGLTAIGTTKDEPTVETFYDNLGGGWFWGGMDGIATTTVEHMPVGTLVLDIFDNQTKKLIWRAVATENLSGDAEKNAKKLHSTVENMFKNFPPRPRG